MKKLGGTLKKLDDKSTPMVFIGYERGTKATKPMIRSLDPYTSREMLFLRRRAESGEFQ